ncbi:protein-S-isoprenylcysteine O-methyltransferase Ste14 [Clostridium pascui]|uniref:methyltransferase family protein n=1 Tax=Clostridium pascui TaxID=46609 RepID=UPI001956FF84|nr:isoprenylcysteine carboxylmethyltransferase family protein [Clostridium pascui]MBM7869011.1 protein-S-isoprenylcysteine O-methyltransferase Ste14 [Clostridium pascui]
MKLIDIGSFALLCIFGISYISKLIILAKKNNIKADVFGKGIKLKKTLVIEKCLKAVTFAGLGIWAVDALIPVFAEKWFVRLYESFGTSFFGLIITLIGVSFFILAMVFLKTSWRAGIDKSTKTELVTSGLYRYSRNPAFVGMDLMFIGTAVTHANLITIALAILVIIGLHLQILQEEKHMKQVFKKEYNEYANKTSRYLVL